MGRGLYRCNYARKPPELPLSVQSGETVDRRYRNTVTWLYYLMHEFAQYGQVKQLPERAVSELCARQRDKKLKGLLVVESKKAFKARSKDGRSPDVADACVQILGMLRHRFGFVPGHNTYSASGVDEDDMDWSGDMSLLAREVNSIDGLDGPGRYA